MTKLTAYRLLAGCCALGMFLGGYLAYVRTDAPFRAAGFVLLAMSFVGGRTALLRMTSLQQLPLPAVSSSAGLNRNVVILLALAGILALSWAATLINS